jgi:hypothetical protein
MQTIINQHGARVFVPDEWKEVFPNLFEGKEFIPPKYQFNPKAMKPTFWIERAGGGYGDVIHMLSALENKIAEIKQEFDQAYITVSVPQHHVFLLDQLKGVTITPSNGWDSQESYVEIALGCREYFDLCCPCAQYEEDCGFDVQKSRVEVFHETLGVKGKVTPPILHLKGLPKSKFPKGKKVVGMALQSTDKWRNWNLDRFLEVAQWLQGKDYFVFTVDTKLTLPGIPGLTGMPLSEVLNQMAYMDGFIGLDSGLTYLAASLGATTVGLYGETKGYTLLEKHYLNGHAVQVIRSDRCDRPCYLNRGFYCNRINLSEASTVCMAEITVKMVKQMWESLEHYGTIGSTRIHK